MTETIKHEFPLPDFKDTRWDIPVLALIQSLDDRLPWSYAGDPNGNVAGLYIGQVIYDSLNNKLYICKTIGDASSAVWQLVSLTQDDLDLSNFVEKTAEGYLPVIDGRNLYNLPTSESGSTTTLIVRDAFSANYLHMRDSRPSGTRGDPAPTNQWNNRALNLSVKNTIAEATLNTSSGIFTLPDGTYRIRAEMSGHDIGTTMARLYNVTDNAVVMYGQTTDSFSYVTTWAVVQGDFTVSGGPKQFRIQQLNKKGGHYYDSGAIALPGVSETYGEVVVWQLAETGEANVPGSGVVVDTTGFNNSSGSSVQEVLEDFDAAISGKNLTIHTQNSGTKEFVYSPVAGTINTVKFFTSSPENLGSAYALKIYINGQLMTTFTYVGGFAPAGTLYSDSPSSNNVLAVGDTIKIVGFNGGNEQTIYVGGQITFLIT